VPGAKWKRLGECAKLFVLEESQKQILRSPPPN
jgi:hypothetical protein